MCGRYTMRTPWDRLAEHFGIPVSSVPELFAARWNVAPTQQVLTVRVEDGGRHAEYMKWGFVPSWSKDGKIAPINATSETVRSKPMFRSAIKKRRCLLAADGFYEWQKTGTRKRPVHFHLKSGEPFGFAGIWETWQVTETAALLTTTPNELVASVHNRMPVILRPEDYEQWLDPGMHDVDQLVPMLQPFPADLMEADPASDFVNNARHEGPECLPPE